MVTSPGLHNMLSWEGYTFPLDLSDYPPRYFLLFYCDHKQLFLWRSRRRLEPRYSTSAAYRASEKPRYRMDYQLPDWVFNCRIWLFWTTLIIATLKLASGRNPQLRFALRDSG